MQTSKKFSRAFEMALFSVVAHAGCAVELSDTSAMSVGGAAAGGYTGLARYTGISGTYGDGLASSTGGTAVSPLGGMGAVGTPKAGGAPVASGGTNSVTGGSNGTGASGPTAGGTVATGGVTSVGGSLAAEGGGTGGRAVGGNSSGGSTTGGAISHGGAGGGSAGGSVAVGGSSTGGAGFVWPGTYNPAGTASDPTGKHNAGTNCMSSACHASTQTSRAFVFGGTVYQTGSTTGAANVQIAITSGTTTVTTYSAANGNFWLPLASTPSIDWATATVHLRNSKGEVTKTSGTSVAAGCNSCHGSTMRISGP